MGLDQTEVTIPRPFCLILQFGRLIAQNCFTVPTCGDEPSPPMLMNRLFQLQDSGREPFRALTLVSERHPLFRSRRGQLANLAKKSKNSCFSFLKVNPDCGEVMPNKVSLRA